MLKELFDKYDCDKSSRHKYHLIYEKEFEKIKDNELNILEIGVFKGSSTLAWLDYFPNANMYGIDIFTRVSLEETKIFKNERVHLLKGDSTSSEIKNTIKEKWGDIKFDIIIDDGLHTPLANKLTFSNLFEFLKEDGKYFIEDVWPLDIMTNNEMQHKWIKKHEKDYTIDNMNLFLSEIKSKKVTRFDLRKQSKEDSYIIKIEN